MARPSLGSLPARKVAVLALSGLLGVGVLAACKAVPAQSHEHSSIAGLNATVGDVAIRNAQVTLAADGNAVLTLALFSSGSNDQLTGVSSTVAASATLPADGDAIDITSAAGAFVTTAKPIVLIGLKNVLVGSNIPITFIFQSTGSVTLQVPVSGTDRSLQVGPMPATPTSSVIQVGPATPTATSTSTPAPSTTPTP